MKRKTTTKSSNSNLPPRKRSGKCPICQKFNTKFLQMTEEIRISWKDLQTELQKHIHSQMCLNLMKNICAQHAEDTLRHQGSISSF